jgi:putative FmdB family regulatory protein
LKIFNRVPIFQGCRNQDFEDLTMPIYEYRCEACGHELEAMQKLSDAPLSDCPECNTDGLKKLISAAAFRLKGSGWYETDFKQGKKKNVHESGSEPAPACAAGKCCAAK